MPKILVDAVTLLVPQNQPQAMQFLGNSTENPNEEAAGAGKD